MRPSAARYDSIAAKERTISEYDSLKAKVDELQNAVEQFTKQKTKESSVAKKAVSFGQGVENWWTKDHVSIMNNSYSVGLFLSAVCLCTLVGVNPTFAAGVAGVLVGGKPVAGALKALAKKLP